MFEARLLQGGLLKKILEAVRELVSEGNWECESKAINLQGMDSSHVALCMLHLDKETFDHYRCDRNITLGLNHANLSKILKCANNDDIITIKAEDQQTDAASFIFESKNKEKTSQFELKLMHIDVDTLGIPETDYSASIKMPSAEFQRICRDLSQFGDVLTIKCVKDGVKFSANGDVGQATISLNTNVAIDNEDEKVTVDLKEPVELTFAIRYLGLFIKATPISDFVTLELNEESPLVVEYRIGDSGYLRYYLAPKIAEDEED